MTLSHVFFGHIYLYSNYTGNDLYIEYLDQSELSVRDVNVLLLCLSFVSFLNFKKRTAMNSKHHKDL